MYVYGKNAAGSIAFLEEWTKCFLLFFYRNILLLSTWEKKNIYIYAVIAKVCAVKDDKSWIKILRHNLGYNFKSLNYFLLL